MRNTNCKIWLRAAALISCAAFILAQTAFAQDYSQLRPAPAKQTDIASGVGAALNKDYQALSKKTAAAEAVKFVKDGMVVGLGSGTTIRYVLEMLAQRIKDENLDVIGIPTSQETEDLARKLGIPFKPLGPDTKIDLVIDGADEVCKGSGFLIKGRGGALADEKWNMMRAKSVIIAVDESKIVNELGEKSPIYIEATEENAAQVINQIAALGGQASIRKEFRTYHRGNIIIAATLPGPFNPKEIEERLSQIPGVVENGIFTRIPDLVIIGKGAEASYLSWAIEEDYFLSPERTQAVSALDPEFSEKELKEIMKEKFAATHIGVALLPIIKWLKQREEQQKPIDLVIPISRAADPIGWLLRKIIAENKIIKKEPQFLSTIMSNAKYLSLGSILTSQLTESEKATKLCDQKLAGLKDKLLAFYQGLSADEKNELQPYKLEELIQKEGATLNDVISELGDAYFNMRKFKEKWEDRKGRFEDFSIKGLRPLLNECFLHTEIGKEFNGKNVLILDEWLETGSTLFVAKLFWQAITPTGSVSFGILMRNDCPEVIRFEELKKRYGIGIDVFGFASGEGTFDWLDDYSLGPEWKAEIDECSFWEYRNFLERNDKCIQDSDALTGSLLAKMVISEVKKKIGDAQIKEEQLTRLSLYLMRRLFTEENVWGKSIAPWKMNEQREALHVELGAEYDNLEGKVESAIKEIISGKGEEDLQKGENWPDDFRDSYFMNPYKWIRDMKGLLKRAYDGWKITNKDTEISKVAHNYTTGINTPKEELAAIDLMMLMQKRALKNL